MNQTSEIILFIGGIALIYGVISNLANRRYKELYQALKELGMIILLIIIFSVGMIILAIIQELFFPID
tara:strand:- start:15 stop:218 length:204 start_codon:yes stop_codon:yes gene_type:complete